MRRAVKRGMLALALALVSGCFISPESGDSVLLSFAVELPHSQVYSQGFSPWDAQNQFYLTSFPKYVRVAVEPEGRDYEQAHATWPDPQRGIGVGEGPDGEVGVDLEVPPGRYRLRVLGYVTDQGRVTAYAEQEVRTLSLEAGQSLDLELQTRPVETGRVALSVRCLQGNVAEWAPTQVMLWDARAALFFPPRALRPTVTGALEAEIPSVPVGRRFWVRIVVQHRITGQEASVEVRRFFGVEQPHELVPVSVVIPCSFST